METGSDKLVWEHDARYYYYKHGPLARTILGQRQVQSIDYAYTLQGWLKGVNSTAVSDGCIKRKKSRKYIELLIDNWKKETCMSRFSSEVSARIHFSVKSWRRAGIQ